LILKVRITMVKKIVLKQIIKPAIDQKGIWAVFEIDFSVDPPDINRDTFSFYYSLKEAEKYAEQLQDEIN